MRKVIVTFNIIWDYHTRLPKMFWYVTACKNINLGIYNKQIRFYAPRTSLETMSDVLNLCIKNKCPKNHDWAFIFHNWELKLKIEYFMVLKLQITQKFLCLLSRGSGPLWRGQPYVHDTYGWPEVPAILPNSSYLDRRPSLL